MISFTAGSFKNHNPRPILNVIYVILSLFSLCYYKNIGRQGQRLTWLFVVVTINNNNNNNHSAIACNACEHKIGSFRFTISNRKCCWKFIKMEWNSTCTENLFVRISVKFKLVYLFCEIGAKKYGPSMNTRFRRKILIFPDLTKPTQWVLIGWAQLKLQ